MSDWSGAYAEVARAVQPDTEPALTHGNGSTADATKELDAIILECVRGVTWSIGATLSYGQIVFPTVRNGHRYRVTVGGVTGATEPSWGIYDYATVSDNGVTYEEDGGDYSNVYDVRGAIRKALEAKYTKASVLIQTGDLSNNQVFEHLEKLLARYAPVGVA